MSDEERLGEEVERLRAEVVATAEANAHAAELMAELHETRTKLEAQVTALADANAHAAELMVELDVTVGALSEANAHAAELMAELDDTRRRVELMRDEAVAANEAKSRFLADMSHELRTPLNAIIGYGEMLAEDATDEDDAALAQDLEKITNAGKHLMGLVDDILDLSKVEAGRMTLQLEEIDLADLVDDVVGTAVPIIAKRNNRLLTDISTDVGRIVTDQRKLRQCLLNLVSNAARFTTEGEVTIRVRCDEAPDPARVVIEVSDTGVGMTAEQMQRIFEPFQQADDHTSQHHGGTGLGLTITRSLCELLGGAIDLESTPGRGTTFAFWVPRSSS